MLATNGVVDLIQRANLATFPLPILDSADPAAFSGVIAAMPFAAKLIVVIGWLLGGAGGSWIALRLCDWRPAAAIVVLFELAACLFNIASLPHPRWMQACAVAMPMLGGLAGLRLHRKPYPGEPLLG